METTVTSQASTSEEPLKIGRSWNQSLLQARLITALQLGYGSNLAVLPNLTLTIAGQKMQPDIALFSSAANMARPYTGLAAALPLAVILILSSYQAFDGQVSLAKLYLLAGVQSCWLVEPTLRTFSVTNSPGVYTSFDYRNTLRDPTTGIELELAPLFS